MKKILFFLTILSFFGSGQAQNHHDYNAQKFDLYYVHDISRDNNWSEITLADQNSNFWTQNFNKDAKEFVTKILSPQAQGGDPRLQEIIRGILSITDKKVEFYVYNDVATSEVQQRQGMPLHPTWNGYAFCKDGSDPTKSWPCAVANNTPTHAGVIGIGNYFLNVASEDRINKYHDQLYLYETIIHELTHTQFGIPNESSLGNVPFYGDDREHYTTEMIPSMNAAFGEAVGNAYAMRYRKSSTWWGRQPTATRYNAAAGQRPPNKPLPVPGNQGGPPNKPLPKTPEQIQQERDASLQTSEQRNKNNNEQYDVITWFNKGHFLFADVNMVCGKPENANSTHCLTNRLGELNIRGSRYNPGKVPALAYSIYDLPPRFLLHNEMVQTNIFADFMTIFNSTAILTQSIKNALTRIDINADSTPHSAFGLVFKEMVKSAGTHKNLSNSPHEGQYMPLAILDFYTGFRIQSKRDLETAIGVKWTRGDVNIDAYFEKLRPQLLQYWTANNNIWDRSILVKFSKELRLNPRVAFGVRATRRN